jgi:hypothetical protein
MSTRDRIMNELAESAQLLLSANEAHMCFIVKEEPDGTAYVGLGLSPGVDVETYLVNGLCVFAEYLTNYRNGRPLV